MIPNVPRGAAVSNDGVEDSMPEDFPEGWALTALPCVCEINPAKPPPDSLPPDALVTFVPMPAVDAEQGAITNPSVRPFSEVRKGFTSFREGDVIMAKITPCMENGKAAIATGLENGLGFGSTEFHVLRSNGAVLPRFMYYFCRRESFRSAAEAEMTGSVGQKRVPTTFLERVAIPLPPVAEQQRIVAKIEELFCQVSAAKDRLARMPRILKGFRQAVLAAAYSGQLTATCRETRPSSPSTEAGRDLQLDSEAELPEGWNSSSIGKVCVAIVDCPHSTPKWTESGEVCLRTTNFLRGSLVSVGKSPFFQLSVTSLTVSNNGLTVHFHPLARVIVPDGLFAGSFALVGFSGGYVAGPQRSLSGFFAPGLGCRAIGVLPSEQ